MAIIAPLPFTLTNGTTADATQVMANFNAIVSAANSNAAHNGANADITALSGLTTPLTPAQGGASFYVGGISGGTANAQTVNTLPANFQLLPGNRVSFISGFTNTGPLTLNVAVQGPVNVQLRTAAGLVACQGGEVVAGMAFTVEYDGVQFELLDPLTLNFFTNSIAGDVALNNTGLFFDGPTVNVGLTGIWFASGTVTLTDTGGASNFQAKLWDGAAVAASAASANVSGSNIAVSLSGVITNPAGNIRISANDATRTTGLIKAAATVANASTITAVRLR